MDYSNNQNNSMNLAGTFLVGAAVGGILGVLFAPKKGSETRQQIADSGNNLASSMRNQYDNIVDTVSEEFESAKSKANDVLEYAVTKAEKAKDSIIS
jgi:gas vesicle protein